MIATIKVNPYAVPEKVVAACERAAAPLEILPFRPHRTSLIQTLAPGLKASTLEKTSRHTRERLIALESALCADLRVPHEERELARAIVARGAAGDDLILICGACSIADRKDVVPAALEQAGGRTIHFGMPVDPGNLLLLGALGKNAGDRNARLRAHAAAQWFRFCPAAHSGRSAGRPRRHHGDGRRRPAPRHAVECESQVGNRRPAAPRIGAIVLAAGRSQRMGANKLTLMLEGKPLVRHAVDAARAAGLEKIIVVVGHEAEKVRAALAGAEVAFVVNQDYAEGLATSLKKGVAALPLESRRRDDLSRRHARHRSRAGRAHDRGFRSGQGPRHRRAALRRPAGQSGAVGAGFLPVDPGADQRRRRRQTSDRPLSPNGSPKSTPATAF